MVSLGYGFVAGEMFSVDVGISFIAFNEVWNIKEALATVEYVCQAFKRPIVLFR